MTDNTELKQAGRAATNSYGDGYQVALIAEDLVDALEEAEAERDAAHSTIAAMRHEARALIRAVTGTPNDFEQGQANMAERILELTGPAIQHVSCDRDASAK